MFSNFSNTVLRLLVTAALPAVCLTSAFAGDPYQLPPDFLDHVKPLYELPNGIGRAKAASLAPAHPGVDSVATFTGTFTAFNQPWSYTMLGRRPESSGFTFLRSPLVPVNVDLLRKDGSVFYHADGTRYVTQTLTSPVFIPTQYDSSPLPTQFADAVQRAEFYKTAEEDWHTLLLPAVQKARTMRVPYGSYHYVVYPDGSVAFILVDANTFLNLLFPATPDDTTTVIGAAEHDGDITTQDVSTFLFSNVFLYQGTVDNCCILGFHTYDSEPGTPANGFREKRYVMNYSSWISPGLFTHGVQDITALSHEITELYNDPFLVNATPWWRAPNGLCQNNLETGDVIEGLPNEIYPITVFDFTYHPQNEALLQWFEFKSPSDAIGHAYSYPNKSVLTGPSKPQKLGCQ